MSVFDGKRLPKETFKLDAQRLRAGWYSDAYFMNSVRILEALAREGYAFNGQADLPELDKKEIKTGDIVVEMQFFTRHKPHSLVVGVDEALAILEGCTGYFEDGQFINTYRDLEVEAVQDGTCVTYDGEPKHVKPVLKVRGRYRDIAALETPILGVLTEATRVATNVYEVLSAARGKDLLFFPARFAHYKLQALHGYAYSLAVRAYNDRHKGASHFFVSTDDQGGWWGGKGGGTTSHAFIACFLGDTAESMVQFARIMPLGVPRIALVDFHNDCVGESLKVLKRMFDAYNARRLEGDTEEAEKYRLFGVRPDTSGNMRDASITPTGERSLDLGVNPRLISLLRKAIDGAWQGWGLDPETAEVAREYCKKIRIVVTGGFNAKKIKLFEDLGVPVDIYGVGSSLLENSSETNCDFTADIVRVKVDGVWHDLAKTGRQAADNPSLKRVK